MLLTVKDDKRAEAYESNLCWVVQNPCVKKKKNLLQESCKWVTWTFWSPWPRIPRLSPLFPSRGLTQGVITIKQVQRR